MNFIRYDPLTGMITAYGSMNVEFVQAEIDAGNPTLHSDVLGDVRNWRVNLTTKELELIPPEELPPPPQPEVFVPPLIISDRQFFQQAAIDGYITQADALAAVQTGFIPLPLQSIVDQIPDANERFTAEMLLSGATIFVRDHPLVAEIGTAFNMTPSQIDTFFRNAMAL